LTGELGSPSSRDRVRRSSTSEGGTGEVAYCGSFGILSAKPL
jgi:hypothetical protein